MASRLECRLAPPSPSSPHDRVFFCWAELDLAVEDDAIDASLLHLWAWLQVVVGDSQPRHVMTRKTWALAKVQHGVNIMANTSWPA